MTAMKGATRALGSMNKTMNLPSLQRIAMEFERENDIMEQRQEMMDDAIDDAMDVGVEEEGDEVVEQVLEEIGVDLSQSVRVPVHASFTLTKADFLSITPARRNTIGIANGSRSGGQGCSGCGWPQWRRRSTSPTRQSEAMIQGRHYRSHAMIFMYELCAPLGAEP